MLFGQEMNAYDSAMIQVGLLFTKEGAVSARWWLYVAAFLFGTALIIIGLSQANTTLTFAGTIIGVALFFTRKYIQ